MSTELLSLHLRDRGMTGGPGSFEIQIDGAIPNFFGHLINRRSFPDAGVANQKIDASKTPATVASTSL